MSRKVLLLQARNSDDPMIDHEIVCFAQKLPSDCHLATHNLVDGPWDSSVFTDYQAVLVGGSGDYGSANNNHPWFRPALDLLLGVVRSRTPLFCSCWGHQALAVAMGGKVETDPLGYELGLLPLRLTAGGAADPLFGELPDPFVAPLGHTEQVVELPPEAVLLASTDRCRVQAFRVRDYPVYGCQFHPELTSQQLWERVDAYIPHLDDKEARARPQGACTDHLITRFLSTHLMD